MNNADKKLMKDNRENLTTLRDKLIDAENIMRQKALKDEDILKAVGLYDYLDNRYSDSIENFLYTQIVANYYTDDIIDLTGKISEYNNLAREDKISAFKYLYQEIDVLAKAVKDYCTYKMLEG